MKRRHFMGIAAIAVIGLGAAGCGKGKDISPESDGGGSRSDGGGASDGGGSKRPEGTDIGASALEGEGDPATYESEFKFDNLVIDKFEGDVNKPIFPVKYLGGTRWEITVNPYYISDKGHYFVYLQNGDADIIRNEDGTYPGAKFEIDDDNPLPAVATFEVEVPEKFNFGKPGTLFVTTGMESETISSVNPLRVEVPKDLTAGK